MNKIVYLCFGLMAVMLAGTAYAQLPANPWDTTGFEKVVKANKSQEDGGVAKISRNVEVSDSYIPSIKYKPINADAEAPKYVPAIDAKGNAKTGVKVKKISEISDSQPEMVAKQEAKNSGTSVALQQDIQNNGTSWRGSGQFGKLNYTGEVTTYGTAYGQEMLAPEVNQHNIKIMLDHMRSLGYKIPESYNDKYANFLSDYRDELREAYNSIGTQDNPFDKMFSGLLGVVEDGTGLDMENLLFNSIELMSKD